MQAQFGNNPAMMQAGMNSFQMQTSYNQMSMQSQDPFGPVPGTQVSNAYTFIFHKQAVDKKLGLGTSKI